MHNAIIRQTDKELADMKEKRARGEIVRGRDTALIWENMFVIYHQSGTKEFCIEKSGMISAVLKKVLIQCDFGFNFRRWFLKLKKLRQIRKVGW